MSTQEQPETATVVRSAERARIRRERVPVEVVRLVRTVETELRTIEVPVRVERLRMERVPLTAQSGHRATGRLPAEADRELEVVLREEIPVVSMQVRAYERVRVRVREVVEEQVVDIRLAEEQVAVDVERT